MLNTTNILSEKSLLESLEISDNTHVLIAVSFGLCVLLWYAAKFETDQILKDVLRKRELRLQQQKQLSKRLQAATSQAALAPKTQTEVEEMSTPHAHQTFRRLNPIQSVERQQRKRSESAAALIAVAVAAVEADAAATPRLCQNFRRLNPDQSVERHRCMLKAGNIGKEGEKQLLVANETLENND